MVRKQFNVVFRVVIITPGTTLHLTAVMQMPSNLNYDCDILVALPNRIWFHRNIKNCVCTETNKPWFLVYDARAWWFMGQKSWTLADTKCCILSRQFISLSYSDENDLDRLFAFHLDKSNCISEVNIIWSLRAKSDLCTSPNEILP